MTTGQIVKFLGLTALLAAAACKKSTPSAALLDAPDAAPAFLPCSEPSATPASQYMRGLLGVLAAASPSRFAGELAADKLCLVVKPSGGSTAESALRKINFGGSRLAEAGNDAEVAFNFAHELAHVLMRHGWGRAVYEDDALGPGYRDALTSDTSVRLERPALYTELLAQTTALKDARDSAFGFLPASDDAQSLQKSANAALAKLDASYADELKTYISLADSPAAGGQPIFAVLLERLDEAAAQDGGESVLVRIDAFLAAYRAAEAGLRDAVTAAGGDLTTVAAAEEALLKTHHRLVELTAQILANDRVKASAEASAGPDLSRKTELEADEVGFQLYLAAGFAPAAATAFLERILRAPDSKEACTGAQEPVKLDPRNTAYWTPCWRIWHLQRQVLPLYKERVGTSTTTAVTPGLAAAQASLAK